MTLFNKLLISSENYKGNKSLLWDSLAMGNHLLNMPRMSEREYGILSICFLQRRSV